MQQASPILYQHDLDRYNDDVSLRHQRNMKELKTLKGWVKEGRVERGMLEFNCDNCFVASEVLHQHLEVFLPLVGNVVGQELAQSFKCLDSVGALLNERIRSDFKDARKETPTLDHNGKVLMGKDTYFYGPTSTPYITHAALLVEKEGKPHLAVVGVRKRGEYAEGVRVKDLGATISLDYLVVAYNFSGATPIALVPGSSVSTQLRPSSSAEWATRLPCSSSTTSTFPSPTSAGPSTSLSPTPPCASNSRPFLPLPPSAPSSPTSPSCTASPTLTLSTSPFAISTPVPSKNNITSWH